MVNINRLIKTSTKVNPGKYLKHMRKIPEKQGMIKERIQRVRYEYSGYALIFYIINYNTSIFNLCKFLRVKKFISHYYPDILHPNPRSF